MPEPDINVVIDNLAVQVANLTKQLAIAQATITAYRQAETPAPTDERSTQ